MIFKAAAKTVEPSAPADRAIPTQKLKRVSHSQTGQDILAEFLLRRNRKIPKDDPAYKGIYVDVGACYPVRASNTYFFYERGWRGLCVDANPATQAAFEAKRPRDVFVAEAVGQEPGVLPFYIYSKAQWNSFDPKRKEEKSADFRGEIQVPVRPLSDMIAKSGITQKIDFMSIDTEGYELEVLRSLNLEVNRPSLLLMECIKDIQGAEDDPAINYAMSMGYRLVAFTGHDAFLLER